VNLVAPNGVFFLCRTSSLRLKKGRGIYSPSQYVAVADLEGQIIRPKYRRIIRPAGLSGPPGRNIRPHIWVTPSKVLSRNSEVFEGGADYLAPGRNIRPRIWVTPTKVLSRFSSTRGGGRIIRPLPGISGPHIWLTPSKRLSRFSDASQGGRNIRPLARLSGLEQGDAIPET
jgi:hypothetical protein